MGRRLGQHFLVRQSILERIAAAACFLPISINPQLSKDLGTRHRAAIGITEDTDDVDIVVSEETGRVSIVEDGAIRSDIDMERLRSRLKEAMGKSEAPELALEGDEPGTAVEKTAEAPAAKR